jgi:hypothetical protein
VWPQPDVEKTKMTQMTLDLDRTWISVGGTLRMPELSPTSPFSVAEMVGVAIRNVHGHIAGLDGSELDGSAGLNERPPACVTFAPVSSLT